jgi:hypothetical protein
MGKKVKFKQMLYEVSEIFQELLGEIQFNSISGSRA